MEEAKDEETIAGEYLVGSNFSQILRTLAGPFDKAEGRVCNGRRFFVLENGRFR
jgi:hypothetical protein